MACNLWHVCPSEARFRVSIGIELKARCWALPGALVCRMESMIPSSSKFLSTQMFHTISRFRLFYSQFSAVISTLIIERLFNVVKTLAMLQSLLKGCSCKVDGLKKSQGSVSKSDFKIFFYSQLHSYRHFFDFQVIGIFAITKISFLLSFSRTGLRLEWMPLWMLLTSLDIDRPRSWENQIGKDQYESIDNAMSQNVGFDAIHLGFEDSRPLPRTRYLQFHKVS